MQVSMMYLYIILKMYKYTLYQNKGDLEFISVTVAIL